MSGIDRYFSVSNKKMIKWSEYTSSKDKTKTEDYL